MDSFVFLGFGLDAWITIVTVFAMFSVLLFTKLRSDVVFLCAVGILYVTGVLDVKETLSGISQPSVAVVGVLFVVIAGLMHTGVLQWIVKHLLGTPNTYTKAVTRLMLPVAALSSFLSNTTVVALFVNIVKMWSKKLNISPSKLLIPLSYASGMGGVCTLIGTPPNLIISGLYEEQTGHAMNILSTTIPGLFCLAVGVLSIIAMRRLLPNRKAPEEAFEATGDYTVEMLVPSDNPHIGMTIGELGLNSVQGGSLIELRHFDDERILSPVPDDEPLMGGDRLVYAGQIGELLELKMSHGLVNADHPVFHYEDAPKSKHFLRTAYLPFGSHLIGTTMGTNGFEQEHKAMLVAVCRRGERIEESPRSVVLQAGDTLLLESMNEWKKKDPYETIEEFKARVNEETAKKKQEELQKILMDEYVQRFAKKMSVVDLKIKPYDAENQSFLIESPYGDIVLPVPRDNNEARDFAENWNSVKVYNQNFVISNLHQI